MWPPELAHALSELRRDLEGAHQGKLRVGLAITVATVVVSISGWPPRDIVQGTFLLLLIVVPAAAIGTGLVVGELIHARAERRALDRADDRELRRLQTRIEEETGRVLGPDTD